MELSCSPGSRHTRHAGQGHKATAPGTYVTCRPAGLPLSQAARITLRLALGEGISATAASQFVTGRRSPLNSMTSADSQGQRR